MENGHVFGLVTGKRLVYLTTVEMKEKLKLREDISASACTLQSGTCYCFGYKYNNESLLRKKIVCASLKSQLHSAFPSCKVVNSFILNYEDKCFYPNIQLIKDEFVDEILLECQLINISSKIELFTTLLKFTSNVQGLNVDVICCDTETIIEQFFIEPFQFNNCYPLYDFDVPVYQSLDEICQFLKNAQKHIVLSEIEILRNCAENITIESEALTNTNNLHPFIVVEGLDGTGKSTLVEKIVKLMNGKQFHTPPTSMATYKALFRKQCDPLCRAYFFLGNYLIAEEIRKQRKISPVVLDRYYFTSVAFAVAIGTMCYGELTDVPETNHQIYNWPKDLMKPSILILLSLDEEPRQKRLNTRGEQTPEEALVSKSLFQRIHKMYGNMKGPCVFTIDASKSKEEVFDNVLNVLKQKGLLKDPSD